MFRSHLHPTPFGLFFGIAVIAFWALLWLWFFAQLSQPGTAGRETGAPREAARAVEPDAGQHGAGAVASARAF